jgi:hypothetical protein
MKRLNVFGLRLLLCSAVVLGGPAHVSAQTRFSYSADGSEVTDSQTALVWRRCNGGQTWLNNSCTDSPIFRSHEDALAYAKTQTGWRLPNVKELASLVDISRSSPAIDLTAFVGTFNTTYWTSTPDVRSPSSAWGVEFSKGAVLSTRRSNLFLIRLVK